MMISKRQFFATAAIAFILAVPYMVQAEEAPAPDQLDPVSIYREAGANPAQEEQIRQMARLLEDTNKSRAREIMGYLEDIRNLSLQPDLDEKRLLGDQNKVNSLQAAMATERIKLLVKIRQLLTPSQRDRLVTLMQRQREARPQ